MKRSDDDEGSRSCPVEVIIRRRQSLQIKRVSLFMSFFFFSSLLLLCVSLPVCQSVNGEQRLRSPVTTPLTVRVTVAPAAAPVVSLTLSLSLLLAHSLLTEFTNHSVFHSFSLPLYLVSLHLSGCLYFIFLNHFMSWCPLLFWPSCSTLCVQPYLPF